MVATHLDGEVVSRDHGGPVRLLVVPMYGYKSLKWLSRDRAGRLPSTRLLGGAGL